MTTSVRTLFASIILTTISLTAVAQVHSIERTDIIKTGEELPYLQTEELSWGAVDSKCLSEAVKYGKWLALKPKAALGTVEIKPNKKFPIKGITLYIGEVVTSSTEKKIVELVCASEMISASTDKKGNTIYALGYNQFNPKKEYYFLLATSAAKQMFDIAFTETYTAPKPEEPKFKRIVLGRLRKSGGQPKAGVVVTLLDENKQPIASEKTDTEGTFRFEKLPAEKSVMARIEEDDTDLIVDLFLLDDNGNIESRATRVGDRLYGFGANEDGFDDLKLLTAKDWNMSLTTGKHGITGRVVDAKTFLYAQANLEVGLYNLNHTRLATTHTDPNGRFEFRNIDRGDYAVRLEGDRTNKYSEMVVVDDLNVPFLFTNSSQVGADGFFEFKKLPTEVVEMRRMEAHDNQMPTTTDFSKMEEGKAIVLKNILFASGSADLLPSSFAELDRLASELQKRPATRIEISGHTDNTGNANINKTLSESRAKSVKDYLVAKGVTADRLSHKGYGDTKPVASNDTEEGKRQNRRVEFVVLK